MKPFLKVLVVGLSLSLLVSAFAEVAPVADVIPVSSQGIAATITGLYVQPGASNLEYAVFTKPLPLTTPNWQQETVNPNYSPAFDLGLQYTFADQVNQISLDWLHVNTSNSAFTSADGVGSSVAPPYYFGPGAQALLGTSANSTAAFNVDNVNLVLGRLVNLGNHIQLQPFAGVNAAYLKEDITSTYVGSDTSHNLYSITSYNTSKFTGVGPRLGVNAAYFFTRHFGVTAEMAGSLLVGTMQSDTNFNSYGGGNTTPVNTSLADQSITRLVPEVDSKLGVAYLIPFNSGSSLTLQAGYMVADYINGINQVVPTSLVPNAFNDGVIAVETSGQVQSDLTLNGPYASLTWKF